LALAERDLERGVFAALGANGDDVPSRVHRQRGVERQARQLDVVAKDTRTGGVGSELHLKARHARLERGKGHQSLLSSRIAVLQSIEPFTEVLPRARQTSEVLFAACKVEQRADSELQMEALFEVPARAGRIAVGGGRAASLEEDLGGGRSGRRNVGVR